MGAKVVVLIPSTHVTVSDFVLMHRWKEGDQRSGDELVRRHYESVRRFFDVRVPRVSEDLTQRTFLACLEALTVRDARSFRAYLFGIARNQMLMYLRRESRLEALRSFDDEPSPAIAGTSRGGARGRRLAATGGGSECGVDDGPDGERVATKARPRRPLVQRDESDRR